MTLAEINALKKSDYTEKLKDRLWHKEDPIPEERPEYTAAQTLAEFKLFKDELIAIETERLRKKDLKDRFDALIDQRAALAENGVSNPALWIKGLVDRDHTEAEAEMVTMESKDLEIENSTETKTRRFIKDRNNEYNKSGATRDLIMEALWEKVVEGKPEKADALQIVREAVKIKVPKPS